MARVECAIIKSRRSTWLADYNCKPQKLPFAIYIRKNIQLYSMACGTLLNDMQLNNLLFVLINLVICPNSVNQ